MCIDMCIDMCIEMIHRRSLGARQSRFRSRSKTTNLPRSSSSSCRISGPSVGLFDSRLCRPSPCRMAVDVPGGLGATKVVDDRFPKAVCCCGYAACAVARPTCVCTTCAVARPTVVFEQTDDPLGETIFQLKTVVQVSMPCLYTCLYTCLAHVYTHGRGRYSHSERRG